MLALTGAQAVPPVNTQASGRNSITPPPRISTRGRPAGQNGPVILTPIKDGGERLVGSGNTILTSAQFNAYRAGNLCVNVHSAANPGGETCAQLRP